MIYFVLQDDWEHAALGAHTEFFTLPVRSGNRQRGVAFYHAPDAGQGEAAFLHLNLTQRLAIKFWINKYERLFAVHGNDYSNVFTHLRSGETDTLSRVHCLNHRINKPLGFIDFQIFLLDARTVGS